MKISLSKSLSQSLFLEGEQGIPQDDSPKELVPLRKDLKKLIKDFPISTLPITTYTTEELNSYRKNLKTLLSFEKYLRRQNKTTSPEFYAYLKSANEAFEKAVLNVEKETLLSIHSEFKKVFSSELPIARENGEVICSSEQLDWISRNMQIFFL